MGKIILPDGSWSKGNNGNNGRHGPAAGTPTAGLGVLPEAVRAHIPAGKANFQLTDEVKAGLTWQQNQALHEEWFHRQAFIRFGFPCNRNPLHNIVVCPHCEGLAERVSPAGARSPCIPCDGRGCIQDTPPVTWGCKHMYPQDEVHPDGLVFHPRRYYCCKTCFRLIEQKKFNFPTEMVMRCPRCINEESHRLHKINPELVVDLTVK